MITMDVKGINWVGDMYQKFETMCLEAEDIAYEDTVEYIETQIQTVGDSVKKLYSDIVGDLIPSISCILDEKEEDSKLPIDQHTDSGFCKIPVQNTMERSAKANTKQRNNSLRIDHNVDNNVVHKTGALSKPSSRSSVKQRNIVSRSRQHVGSMGINEIGASSSYDKQGHKTMQEDHLKLEESCVIVTGDEIQSIPKEIGNLKANKKTRRQGFSLSKNSARKQEYKELAVWHGSSEKVKGVSTVSESEWELL